MADDVQFQTITVTSIRGLEARTIAKQEAAGWEFVSQTQGTLRSELTFRRPKPKTPWKLLAGAGVAAAVLVAVISIGASLERSDPASETPVASSPADADPTPSPTVRTEAAPTEGLPEPAEQAEVILTMETSRELASLLTGPDQGPSVEQFAATHEGSLVEFDASIGAMAKHGAYDTRYDILISYGDYSETVSSGGPSFQFRDVNTTSDLHLSGANIPDTIGVGDNIHVVARVIEFDAFRGLFQLEPVATSFR